MCLYLLKSRTANAPAENGRGVNEGQGDAGPESAVMRARSKRYNRYQRTMFDRKGPGEQGRAAKLTKEEQELADSLFKKEAFNIVASDKISLERNVHDTREVG